MYSYSVNSKTCLIHLLHEGQVIAAFEEIGLLVSTARLRDGNYCSVLKHGEANFIEQLLPRYKALGHISLIRLTAEEVDPERLTHFINASVQPLAILNQLRLVRTQ